MQRQVGLLAPNDLWASSYHCLILVPRAKLCDLLHMSKLPALKNRLTRELTCLAGIGWNMSYPFNTGDLLCSGQCTSNYLDNNTKVPWEDLRYMFGEIIYGGHIVEDWDRRLAFAYLTKCMNDGLLENAELFPSFVPPPSAFTKTQVRLYLRRCCLYCLHNARKTLVSVYMCCKISPIQSTNQILNIALATQIVCPSMCAITHQYESPS